MLQPIKTRFDKAGRKVAEALEKRGFCAYYCATADDAVKQVLAIIPEDSSVAWGGSMTVDALHIKEKLYARGQTMIDRDKVQADERAELMRRSLMADTFLMSANAVTEKGELFNIDGTGNRVAALCYGPKQVVVVAGMNKVVPDMNAAYVRVRGYAAPVNAQRFGGKTPCTATGECGDCNSPDCICNQMVATRRCKPAGRIVVVLVGEELGF